MHFVHAYCVNTSCKFAIQVVVCIIQDEHPNPGVPFKGATSTGYLPNNNEGRQVRDLLKRAFDARLIFTVGRSVTSGQDNVVVLNGIPLKTETTGP